jgi:membrane protein
MLSSLRYYIRGLVRQIYEKDVFLWAQAIAFKVLITLVPIVILGTGLFGRVLRQERPFASVERVIRDFVPAYGADRLIGFLGQLQGASTALTIIGVATLVVTVMTLFTTLRIVLANIFREDWHSSRSLLRGYLFDMRMALQAGLFFVLSIGLTVLVQMMGPAGLSALAGIGAGTGSLQVLWDAAVHGLSVVLPFLMSVGMFFQLLWFTPVPRPPKRSALAGAVVGALLWEAAKFAFTAYATHMGDIDESFESLLGDTFLLVLMLLFWAYYTGLVLCVGAIVTLLYEARQRLRHRAAETAATAGPDLPGAADSASRPVGGPVAQHSESHD